AGIHLDARAVAGSDTIADRLFGAVCFGFCTARLLGLPADLLEFHFLCDAWIDGAHDALTSRQTSFMSAPTSGSRTMTSALDPASDQRTAHVSAARSLAPPSFTSPRMCSILMLAIAGRPAIPAALP